MLTQSQEIELMTGFGPVLPLYGYLPTVLTLSCPEQVQHVGNRQRRSCLKPDIDRRTTDLCHDGLDEASIFLRWLRG